MKDALIAAAIALATCTGIAALQPNLGFNLRKYAKRDDVFVLPPPDQLKAMTLGYRAAGADILWAKLVVEHGMHWEDKRPFPDLPNYIDAILALDPDHPTIYDFIDTLILYSPGAGRESDARLVREYFERAIKRRPLDYQIWLRYGDFMAFLSPSFLKDQNEIVEWKKAGALALGRAVELGADPERALSASTILGKSGEKKAQVLYLQRAYAVTDDLETRRQIKSKLEKLQVSIASEGVVSAVEDEWRTRYPIMSRSAVLLIGPHRDPGACAGVGATMKKGCADNWTDATRER
jgi:hypothetical protein